MQVVLLDPTSVFLYFRLWCLCTQGFYYRGGPFLCITLILHNDTFVAYVCTCYQYVFVYRDEGRPFYATRTGAAQVGFFS